MKRLALAALALGVTCGCGGGEAPPGRPSEGRPATAAPGPGARGEGPGAGAAKPGAGAAPAEGNSPRAPGKVEYAGDFDKANFYDAYRDKAKADRELKGKVVSFRWHLLGLGREGGRLRASFSHQIDGAPTVVGTVHPSAEAAFERLKPKDISSTRTFKGFLRGREPADNYARYRVVIDELVIAGD